MKDDNELLNSTIDAAIVEVDSASKSAAPEGDPKDVPTPDDLPSADEAQEESQTTQTDLEPDSSGTAKPEGEAPNQAASSPLAAPVHWSPERAAKFATFPREAQEIILQREQELERKLQEATSKRGNGKDYEARFYADFNSPEEAAIHKAKLAASGVSDPVSELHRYRAWDRVLEADPHAAIAKLMKQNGFNPYDFLEQGADQRENQYQDPRVDEAIEAAEQAKRELKEYREGQEQARMRNVVTEYKAGNFSDGTPRAKFMTVFAPQITHIFNSLSQSEEYQHLSEVERLHYATEYVRSQASEIHGARPAANQPPQKTREQIIADSKKAQAAATATTGAPNTGSIADRRPRVKGKNFNEKAANIADQAVERHWNPAH